MPAPPGLFFGVNGEDHHVWEYNYLGFGHFGLHSPGAFTPGGLVSPGLHRMMEIDPDNWFADAHEQPQGGYTLGEFFKDDSSIFNEPEDQGGVFA